MPMANVDFIDFSIKKWYNMYKMEVHTHQINCALKWIMETFLFVAFGTAIAILILVTELLGYGHTEGCERWEM